MTARPAPETPTAPDQTHHCWCEGHIDCPHCARETCARVVVWAPGGVPDVVICLGCMGTFGVADHGREVNPMASAIPQASDIDIRHSAVIDYVNHRGERSLRTIVPIRIYWGNAEWHPDEQWLLDAFDANKGATRTFALAAIRRWKAPRWRRPRPGGPRPKVAWRIHCRPLGTTSVVAATTRGKAVMAGVRGARAAGHTAIDLRSFAARRAPEYDSWAIRDESGVAFDEDFLKQLIAENQNS